jgi:hypothetical protein
MLNYKNALIAKTHHLQYAKVFAPHIALVIAVAIVAVIFAFIFKAIELPHELKVIYYLLIFTYYHFVQVREDGVSKIAIERKILYDLLRSNINGKAQNFDEWRKSVDTQLNVYSKKLYRTFT